MDKQLYQFGGFILSPQEQRLWEKGIEVRLEPKQFQLLCMLVRRANQVVTVDEISREVWPETDIEVSRVSQAMSKLRRLLEGRSGNEIIRVVYRQGYLLIAHLEVIKEDTPTNREQAVRSTILRYGSNLNTRLLKIFLCHSSGDKTTVRQLYAKLRSNNFEPWMDEKNLLPGQDWNYEIPKVVRGSDAVIVFLSKGSINRAGYVQKEIKLALDVADEQPEGAIFLIPAKLEDCDVPDRLRRWHWINLHKTDGYEMLVSSLERRASDLGINLTEITTDGDWVDEEEKLYDEDLTLAFDTNKIFTCELEQGEGLKINLTSTTLVDVLIMDQYGYEEWRNKGKIGDSLNWLLYKEYLEIDQLETYYHCNLWLRTFLVVIRNEQEVKADIHLKINRKRSFFVKKAYRNNS